MSCEDAQITLAELMGTLEPESRKGCVRLQMFQGKTWGELSENEPDFYTWQGRLHLSAPQEILNPILMPIIKFAVSVGGVGRGWRRPLHIFHIDNGRAFARGSDLQLNAAARKKGSTQVELKSCSLPINPEVWISLYQNWREAAQALWSERVKPFDFNPPAEAFSPTACAIYAVPGPKREPLDRNYGEWEELKAENTRGAGMRLIYQPDYKRQVEVGGKY
jgi:CRISPR-associated protein Cmr6